jgi:hypothetical protein
MPQRWGNTPWGFIEDHQEEWGFLQPHILTGQLTQQPDIWAQITVPNEFQPIGKYNIGITAGIETTICPPEWLEGVNRMNVTWVSSKHSKKVFEDTKFEKKDQQGRVIGLVQLEKPMEVIFEGADLDKYKILDPKELTSIDLSPIKESFAYLFVGHWINLNSPLGEDRKNVGLLIKAFFETFKNKLNKPALILKTSGAVSSYMDRDAILRNIDVIKKTVNSKDLPNVYLLHGEFTDTEINELYNNPKVKAMVSLTKGEGFGRPLLEFSLVKKPIITTNWSGHTDFLHYKNNVLLNGELNVTTDGDPYPAFAGINFVNDGTTERLGKNNTQIVDQDYNFIFKYKAGQPELTESHNTRTQEPLGVTVNGVPIHRLTNYDFQSVLQVLSSSLTSNLVHFNEYALLKEPLNYKVTNLPYNDYYSAYFPPVSSFIEYEFSQVDPSNFWTL